MQSSPVLSLRLHHAEEERSSLVWIRKIIKTNSLDVAWMESAFERKKSFLRGSTQGFVRKLRCKLSFCRVSQGKRSAFPSQKLQLLTESAIRVDPT